MNMIKSGHGLIALAAIALMLASALVSAAAKTVSEAQTKAGLTTADASTVSPDRAVSDVQKFFPASFR
jgi:hypothetical protein